MCSPFRSQNAPGHTGENQGQGNAYGWGLQKKAGAPTASKDEIYTWDSENRLVESQQDGRSVRYLYDREGNRTVKRGMRGETLYVDRYYQVQNQDEVAKHIFVGDTRIATRLGAYGYYDSLYESASVYYYHPDHLGSTTFVTDNQGAEFEHLEYTPYGEQWIDEGSNKHLIGYRFTGKELDEETGLYYYGARYFDPSVSVWMSADPAMGKYLPEAPVNDEAKKRNGNLPGMGGVFNPVNLAMYHYAGNNPLRFTDPDGEYLHIVISKSTGKMTVTFTLPGVAQSRTTYQLNVITNVVRDNPNNKAASDQNRTQVSNDKGITNPSQVKNGKYPLTGTRAPSPDAGNKAPEYKFGKSALDVGVIQNLPDVDDPTVTHPDSGYMIHITSALFTNGCVGIWYDKNDPESKAKAIAEMDRLVALYNATKGIGGDKDASIEYKD